ncbi:ATP-binding protein [Candidatus Binatia bacterium]|nr:ATP-binding protein [Candidatus Binatia bacterium]
MLPAVHGDAIWLRRALANLVANAVRCTPDGGAIALTAVAAGASVEFGVADTGIGIEATRLADLFEPFAPAHGDVDLHTSGEFDFGARGLGLGLAITRAIVEAHGGRLTVDSARGAGSRFSFTVPVASG